MSIGVWMVPVALVALVVLLFASAWIEGFVAPIGDEFDIRTREALNQALEGVAPPPVSLFVDADPSPEFRSPAA